MSTTILIDGFLDFGRNDSPKIDFLKVVMFVFQKLRRSESGNQINNNKFHYIEDQFGKYSISFTCVTVWEFFIIKWKYIQYALFAATNSV